MIKWRYQLIRYENGDLGVHEVIENGNQLSWTEQNIIGGETLKDILAEIEYIKSDICKFPVLNLKDIKSKTSSTE